MVVEMVYIIPLSNFDWFVLVFPGIRPPITYNVWRLLAVGLSEHQLSFTYQRLFEDTNVY